MRFALVWVLGVSFGCGASETGTVDPVSVAPAEQVVAHFDAFCERVGVAANDRTRHFALRLEEFDVWLRSWEGASDVMPAVERATDQGRGAGPDEVVRLLSVEAVQAGARADYSCPAYGHLLSLVVRAEPDVAPEHQASIAEDLAFMCETLTDPMNDWDPASRSVHRSMVIANHVTNEQVIALFAELATVRAESRADRVVQWAATHGVEFSCPGFEEAFAAEPQSRSTAQ